MRTRVTLGVGLPYQIDRVTPAAGLSFCLRKYVNACYYERETEQKCAHKMIYAENKTLIHASVQLASKTLRSSAFLNTPGLMNMHR